MYATAAKVRELHFFTRLNREFKSDGMHLSNIGTALVFTVPQSAPVHPNNHSDRRLRIMGLRRGVQSPLVTVAMARRLDI